MRIDIVRCADLRDSDGFGKSDAYVKLDFQEDDIAAPRRQQTHVMNNSLNPVFNVVKFVMLKDDCKSFRATVMDEDVGLDDSLGHCTLLRAQRGHRHERHGGWMALEDGRHGRIEIYYQEIELANVHQWFSQHGEQAYAAERHNEFDLLEVHVNSGENCKGGGFGKPDPYAKIEFEDLKEDNMVAPREILHTPTVNKTRDPSWNCVFHYLIHRDVTRFTIRVMDEDIGLDDSLGHVHVLVGDLNDFTDNRFALESGKGTIHVQHFRLSPLALLN